jgi:hypothetical protein
MIDQQAGLRLTQADLVNYLMNMQPIVGRLLPVRLLQAAAPLTRHVELKLALKALDVVLPSVQQVFGAVKELTREPQADDCPIFQSLACMAAARVEQPCDKDEEAHARTSHK